MMPNEALGRVEAVADMHRDGDQRFRRSHRQPLGDRAASDVEATLVEPGLGGIGAEDVERDRHAVRRQLDMNVAPHPIEHQLARVEPRTLDEAEPRILTGQAGERRGIIFVIVAPMAGPR